MKRGIYNTTYAKARVFIEGWWKGDKAQMEACKLGKVYRPILEQYAATHKPHYLKDEELKQILTPGYDRISEAWEQLKNRPESEVKHRTRKAVLQEAKEQIAMTMQDKRDEVLDFDNTPEYFGKEFTFKFNGFKITISKL